MNKNQFKNELTLLYQNLTFNEEQFIDNFGNLFLRFVSEIAGEGLVYPVVDKALLVLFNDQIKDIFITLMKDVKNKVLSSTEYCFKVGKALDEFYLILVKIIQKTPSDNIILSVVNLSNDIKILLEPILLNPLSSSFDISSAIVDAFVIKLESTTIFISTANTTLNWITS